MKKASKFLLTCITCATVLSAGSAAEAMVVNQNVRGGGEISSNTASRGLTDNRLGNISRGYDNYRGPRGMAGNYNNYGRDNYRTNAYGYATSSDNITSRTADMNYRGFTGSGYNRYNNANIPSVADNNSTPGNLGTAVNTDNNLNAMRGTSGSYRSGGTTGRNDSMRGGTRYPSPYYRNGELNNTGEHYGYYSANPRISRSINGMGNRMRNAGRTTSSRNTDRHNDLRGQNETVRRSASSTAKNETVRRSASGTTQNEKVTHRTESNIARTESRLDKIESRLKKLENAKMNTPESGTTRAAPAHRAKKAETTTHAATTRSATPKSHTAATRAAIPTPAAKTHRAAAPSATQTHTTPKTHSNITRAAAPATTQSATTTPKTQTNQTNITRAAAPATTQANTTAQNQTNITRAAAPANQNNNMMTKRNAAENNYSFRNRDNVRGYENQGYRTHRFSDNLNDGSTTRQSGYRADGYNMRGRHEGNYRANRDGNAQGASGVRSTVNPAGKNVTRSSTAGKTNDTSLINNAGTAKPVTPKIATTRQATTRAARYRDTVVQSRNATITFVILLVAIAALLALAIYALMRPRHERMSYSADSDGANRRR